MVVTFHIEYGVGEGETIFLNVRQADGCYVRHPMTSKDEEHWTLELRVDPDDTDSLDYYYTKEKETEVVHSEWAVLPHRLDLFQSGVTSYEVYNRWQDIPSDAFLYTTAFTDCLYERMKKPPYNRSNPSLLRLVVHAPQLTAAQHLVLVGAHPVIGEWHADRGVPCHEVSPNVWMCSIDTEYTAGETLEFKFIAVSKKVLSADAIPSVGMMPALDVEWEIGGNRTVVVPRLRKGQVVEYDLHDVHFEMWRPRIAGLAMPVHEMRTGGSCGVGDFGGLKRVVEWAAASGLRMVQIQPVNDTALVWKDYDADPYSAVSRYALNPLYAQLDQLPEISPAADLPLIYKQKLACLRRQYVQEKDSVFESSPFTEWLLANKHWLPEYAALCCKRDKEEDGEFYFYVQYLLACQLDDVRRYARSVNVILMGDVPVEAYPQDYDVWEKPEELHRYFDACRFDSYLRCKVPETIGEMRMLTLQEFPMVSDKEIVNPDTLPYFSISMVHDPALPADWWLVCPASSARVYSDVLARRDDRPLHLSRWLARDIAMRNLMAPSMITLLTWQEWHAAASPANHDTLDAAIADISFQDNIREMLRQAYR